MKKKSANICFDIFTMCRWEEIEGNKLLKFPRVEAPNGFRVQVSTY